MPNWVQNIIHLDGSEENIKKVLSLVKSNESEFDFNLILPMPEELNITSSSNNDLAIMCYASNKLSIPYAETPRKWTRFIHNFFDLNFAETVYGRLKDRDDLDELYELGKKCCSNIEKYGYVDWYNWRIHHWGTKWSADGVFVEDNVIEFQTAWSCPDGILNEFAKICKLLNVTFEGWYADENRGYNTGYFNSEIGIIPNEDASYEAIETYNRCWGEVDYEDEM